MKSFNRWHGGNAPQIAGGDLSTSLHFDWRACSHVNHDVCITVRLIDKRHCLEIIPAIAMDGVTKTTNRKGLLLMGQGGMAQPPPDAVKNGNTSKQITRFFVVGACLIGIALFVPDAGHQFGVMFVHLARNAMWQCWFEWNAAWCSLKIIFFSLGMFFILDSVGTLLITRKHQMMGATVFLMHLGPFGGMLAGVYLLTKSLL